MRALAAVLLVASLSGPARAETWLDDAVRGAFRPTFHAATALSDSLYSAIRRVMPRSAQAMPVSKLGDGYGAFEARLRRDEGAFAERLRLGGAGPSALEEQAAVLLNAFSGSLLDRYGLEDAGRRAAADARRRGWNPASAATAGLIGGAVAYLGGVHAGADVWRFHAAARLRPLERLQRGDTDGFASVEVGLKGSPWTAGAKWGARSGSLVAERFGVDYRLRY